MLKGCFAAPYDTLGYPEHAYAVDRFRVLLVEPSGNFCVFVPGKGFESLDFFAAGLDRVDKFAARAELLARGWGELVLSCHIPHLLYQVSKAHHPVVLPIPTISGRGLACVERVSAKAMGKVRIMI